MKRLLLLALPLLVAAGEPAVLLRYQFKPGQTLTYRTELMQRVSMNNAKGQLGNLALTTTYGLDLVQKVNSANGEEIEISATASKVDVKLDGPMAKSAPQIAELLRKVGFTVKLDSRGKVLSLAESADTPDQVKKLVVGLKNALGQLLPMLPQEPQAPGGVWRQQFPVPVEMPSGDRLQAMLTVDYLLRGFSEVQGRPCADLGMRLHLGLAGALGQASARVVVSGEGTGQGFAAFDLERGILVDTALTLVTESQFRGAATLLTQRSESRMRMALQEPTPTPR